MGRNKYYTLNLSFFVFQKILPFYNPALVFHALCKDEQYAALLESQKHGRYSYIAYAPWATFTAKEKSFTYTEGKHTLRKKGDPMVFLRALFAQQKIKRSPTTPLFSSGAVGYFGYDTVRLYERLPTHSTDDLALPDIALFFPQIIFCFDHKEKRTTLLVKDRALFSSVLPLYEALQKRLPPLPSSRQYHTPVSTPSTFTRTQYERVIKKARSYVYAGDAFQIKLSQRFTVPIEENPWITYLRLRRGNPSPYGGFLRFPFCTLVSCSPEHLIQVKGDQLETRPIGGTYPRGKTRQEDKALVQRFLKDSKEQAEHMMLIDLERNDLGRVSTYGSVNVTESMTIERYAHLMHIVTNIRGKKRTDVDIFDVLFSLLPGGTLTGCPKVRVMEIIEELEPVRRGPYAGAMGFFTFAQEMDCNIIIRTLLVVGNKGYIQVGGGIVADSVPKKEYEETLYKALALFRALP